MLKRVEPLRNELLDLESQANDNKLKGDEVMKLIADLERSIAKYKEEYALLISQAQAIKADLSAVEMKVGWGGGSEHRSCEPLAGKSGLNVCTKSVFPDWPVRSQISLYGTLCFYESFFFKAVSSN